MRARIEDLKRRAGRLKLELRALALAYRDPRCPLTARLLAAVVVAYAFSPIDLIPDFVPILGYLDDLILLPLGITCALKLIPPPLMSECRDRAREELGRTRFVSRTGAVVIAAVWILLAALAALILSRFLA